MTAEQGKPLAAARGEVAYAAGFLEWFAEEARRVHGDVLTPHASDKRLTVLRQFEYRTVGLNTSLISTEVAPFGESRSQVSVGKG